MELLEFLRSEDELTLSDRVTRLQFIMSQFDGSGNLLLPGGDVSLAAFDEMRLCYIGGYFVGCVVLAQVFLEQLWSSYLNMADESCHCSSFLSLMTEIRKRNWITLDEYNDLDQLRKNRNPYVHRKGFDYPQHPLRRAVSQNTHFLEITEQDAQHAIKTVMQTLNKPLFLLRGD